MEYNIPKHTEYIYIIKTREAIRANQNVLKLGMTLSGIQNRLKSYPKGYEEIFLYPVNNTYNLEQDLLRKLRRKYTPAIDYGKEYFIVKDIDGYKQFIRDVLLECEKNFNLISFTRNIKDNNKKYSLKEFLIYTYTNNLFNCNIFINYSDIIELFNDFKNNNNKITINNKSDFDLLLAEFNTFITKNKHNKNKYNIDYKLFNNWYISLNPTKKPLYEISKYNSDNIKFLNKNPKPNNSKNIVIPYLYSYKNDNMDEDNEEDNEEENEDPNDEEYIEDDDEEDDDEFIEDNDEYEDSLEYVEDEEYIPGEDY